MGFFGNFRLVSTAASGIDCHAKELPFYCLAFGWSVGGGANLYGRVG
jgi:hypothetical protein